MLVYAPQKVSGIYASVRFVDGVGETDNVHLLSWFKEHGYTIKNVPKIPEKPTEKIKVESVPEFAIMSPNEIKAWMTKNNIPQNYRGSNHAKLVEYLNEVLDLD